jgi:hypothetical protein
VLTDSCAPYQAPGTRQAPASPPAAPSSASRCARSLHAPDRADQPACTVHYTPQPRHPSLALDSWQGHMRNPGGTLPIPKQPSLAPVRSQADWTTAALLSKALRPYCALGCTALFRTGSESEASSATTHPLCPQCVALRRIPCAADAAPTLSFLDHAAVGTTHRACAQNPIPGRRSASRCRSDRTATARRLPLFPPGE